MKSKLSSQTDESEKLNDFFSEGYDLEFNHSIIEELTKKEVRVVASEKKLYFDGKIKEGYKSPITFSPLKFFNLFYHEYDFINKNKSKPLSIVPHLSELKLEFFDRLYFYNKLSEILSLNDNNKTLLFISKIIKEEYLKVWNLFMEDNLTSYIEYTTKEEQANFLNKIDTLTNTKERLRLLINFKHKLNQYEPKSKIDLDFIKTIDNKINYYQDLIKYDINIPKRNSKQLSKAFHEHLIHDKNKNLAIMLKKEFKAERGKNIRFMIEALKGLNILCIPGRKNKEIHRALESFFNRDIGTYESVFNCNISKADNEEISNALNRIKFILAKLNKTKDYPA